MRRLALIGSAIVALSASPAGAQPYNLTLAGASPGGLWSLIGLGVDGAVKAAFPGSTITYQTSGGGFANVLLVQQNRAPLGIVHGAELKVATEGTAPFRAPVKELRVIANLYNWSPQQIVVTKSFADKYGIKTFDDIAAKKPPLRVAVNKRGNIAEHISERLFAAIGFPLAEIEQRGGLVVYAASEEQSDLMKDRRIDMINNSIFVPQKSILEVAHALDVVMLPISESVIKKVAAEVGIDPYVIKAKSYDFQTQDIPTVSLGASLVVHESMDEKTAYNLAKALVENIDKMQGVHPSMKALTPELMVSQGVIPYHPGAVKYFKEKRLQS
ncbi:MAG: TAXI family TRAP transporter solute-binding subunit [Pseudomonadota bacterium]